MGNTNTRTSLTLPKVSVGIPAYNEQENIVGLLQSLVAQIRGGLHLAEIVVVSDGSTDRTDQLVRGFASRFPLVRLVADGRRLGKAARLNQLFRYLKGDIFFLFDADVMPQGYRVLSRALRHFAAPEVAMVGLDKKPVAASCLVERLVNTWDQLWHGIRIHYRGGDNIHNFSSCAFAIRRNFARQTRLPVAALSVTKFLYLTALANRQRIHFSPASVVYFRSPTTIGDYLLQLHRFQNVKQANVRHFGQWAAAVYHVPLPAVLGGMLRGIFRSPLISLLSLSFHVGLQLLPYPGHQRLAGRGLWPMAVSTKRGIPFYES